MPVLTATTPALSGVGKAAEDIPFLTHHWESPHSCGPLAGFNLIDRWWFLAELPPCRRVFMASIPRNPHSQLHCLVYPYFPFGPIFSTILHLFYLATCHDYFMTYLKDCLT